MLKAAFIVPCRNKEKHVADTVRSVLAQTYTPLEIILSDQGSEDRTLEILNDLASNYKGPHNVRVLQCPNTKYKGMVGLNNHINWIHEQTDADIMIVTGADDINHYDRAAKVMEAFREHPEAVYVGTCNEFMNADGSRGGITGYVKEDRFITPSEIIEFRVGGSASNAWRRDFYMRHKLMGLESADTVIPFFAALEGYNDKHMEDGAETIRSGFYYIHTPLYAYIFHADVNNTGMEGVYRAATNDEERMQASELNHFHICQSWFSVMRRVKDRGLDLPERVESELLRKLLESSCSWTMLREQMVLERVNPSGIRC